MLNERRRRCETVAQKAAPEEAPPLTDISGGAILCLCLGPYV